MLVKRKLNGSFYIKLAHFDNLYARIRYICIHYHERGNKSGYWHVRLSKGSDIVAVIPMKSSKFTRRRKFLRLKKGWKP